MQNEETHWQAEHTVDAMQCKSFNKQNQVILKTPKQKKINNNTSLV